MARKSLKENILDAAERVIGRQGLANTTIEAVAAEAGVSKGGLFYHFESKKDLLLQMLDRHEIRFKELRDGIMAELPESPGRFLKATILASVSLPARQNHRVANLITLLDDPDLRERIAVMKRRALDEVVRDSQFPERSALAVLAVDGLWVSEMFERPVINATFRRRIIDSLLQVIDELSREPGPVRSGRAKHGAKKAPGRIGNGRAGEKARQTG